MPSPRRSGLRVGVVGATGMVGRELLHLLERGELPVAELLPFASGRSGARVRYRARSLRPRAPDRAALGSCDLVFFVSSDEVSLRLAPDLAARGVWTIDDSAAFRLDPRVPLVIPEVNAHALRPGRRLVAGPNCTMTGLAVAAAPLRRALGLREVRVASYQSVSGAGKAALAELIAQAGSLSRSLGGRPLERAPAPRPPRASALPAPIAFNVIPQVGSFGPGGETSEERKVAAELRKVLEAPGLRIGVTAVRVPTLRGHALSAWLVLGSPCGLGRAAALLSRAPGLTLSRGDRYPTPLSCAGKPGVHAGRLRAGPGPRELSLWIVSDNLLKGAALNSVQIARALLERGWLRRR